MRRPIAVLLLVASIVTFSACTASPPPAPSVQTSTPKSVSPSPVEQLSKPYGTWTLSSGLPVGTPEHLPLPKDRWIEDMSTEIDESGGMIEFWVEEHEVDAIISDLEAVGWNFGDSEGAGDKRIYTAYTSDMSESLYFGFRPVENGRDAHLTVTWTADLGSSH